MSHVNVGGVTAGATLAAGVRAARGATVQVSAEVVNVGSAAASVAVEFALLEIAKGKSAGVAFPQKPVVPAAANSSIPAMMSSGVVSTTMMGGPTELWSVARLYL